MSDKVIPYWKVKTIKKLESQIAEYESLIKAFRDEERKIRERRKNLHVTFEEFNILKSKYGYPKTNEFYIRNCKIRIDILKSEDISEEDYKNMAIV